MNNAVFVRTAEQRHFRVIVWFLCLTGMGQSFTFAQVQQRLLRQSNATSQVIQSQASHLQESSRPAFRPINQDSVNGSDNRLAPPLRSALGNVHPLAPQQLVPTQNSFQKPSQSLQQEQQSTATTTRQSNSDFAQSTSEPNRQTLAPAVQPNGSKPRFVGDQLLRKSAGNLCDVHFLDQRIGIAVGTGGLIWRTTDGGAHWNPCHSPTDVDLVAVTFHDHKMGWAVGGEALPVRGLHRGVVLTTNDGGMSWKKVETTLLPRLVDVNTTADGRVWATAIATAQYPQTIFESLDGGHSWNPLQFQWPKNKDSALESEASILKESVRDSSNNISVQPAWYDGTRSVFTHPVGVFSVANNQAIFSKSSEPSAKSGLRFRSIREVSKRLLAISYDGNLYQSLDQGDNWQLVKSTLSEKVSDSAEDFYLMTTSQDSIWLAQRYTGRILCGNVRTNQWHWQTLPTPAPVQSLHFTDSTHGWAVGAMGNVLKTVDGGKKWVWEHSLHQNLAVLVVAEDSGDIPVALMTQLASNNHLNVGVLVGNTSVPSHVFVDAFSQSDAAWCHIDRTPFDAEQPLKQSFSIQQYLTGLQPQILLICPSQKIEELGSIKATTWIQSAQRLRASIPFDPMNPWGILGQTVELAANECDSSTSMDGYAPALEQLLGDAAFGANLLQQQWNLDDPSGLESGKNVNQPYKDIIGIRRIASVGNQQLGWFSSVADLDGNSLNSRLSRFIGRSSAPAIFNKAQQVSLKRNFIQTFAAATTNRPHLRSQWLHQLTTTLVSIQETARLTWLVELAEACEHSGDQNKATLAYLEAWNWGSDKPVGLYALTQAIPRLSSDEHQWHNRIEASEIAQQELVEMQQRMQDAIERGLTSEEAELDEALRRWGINPAEKDQVPPHIIARIEALERARKAEGGKQDPAEQTLIEIPNFETFANRSVSPTKSFDDPAGNKLTRQTTVVSWGTVQESASSVAPAASQQSVSNQRNTIVDQLADDRISQVYRITKLADGLWPHLQGVPEWWKSKAYLAREMGDLPQIEATWNRFKQLQIHQCEITLVCNDPHKQSEVCQGIAAFEKQIAAQGPKASESRIFGNPDSKIIAETISVAFNWQATWANERPFLDGELNDPLWHLDETEKPIKISISNDEQFLYLGLQIDDAELTEQHESNPNANPNTSKPDANRATPNRMARDLANPSDAILIHIDTDRDYQTDFVLTFDTRGRITERQGNGRNWDPTMYVAQDRQGELWNLEVAIDLADLSLPRIGQYWHMRVERTGKKPHEISGWTRLKDPLESIAIP